MGSDIGCGEAAANPEEQMCTQLTVGDHCKFWVRFSKRTLMPRFFFGGGVLGKISQDCISNGELIFL